MMSAAAAHPPKVAAFVSIQSTAPTLSLTRTETSRLRYAYDQTQALLNSLRGGCDRAIAVFGARIDSDSQRLLTDRTLGLADRAALTAQIAANGTLKASYLIAKTFIPDSPEALGIQIVLNAAGGVLLKNAGRGLKAVFSTIDSKLGFGFTAKLAKTADSVAVQMDAFLGSVQRRVDAVGNLLAWQGIPGHVLQKHVGLSAAALAKRLADDATITAASTFVDAAAADEALRTAVVNYIPFNNYMESSALNGSVTVTIHRGAGTVLLRGAKAPVDATTATFIFRRASATARPDVITVLLK